MEKYLFVQQEANIQKAVPEVNEHLVENTGFGGFPHIREFGQMEFKDIRLRSLDLHYNDGIEICYIHKGKYQWNIEDQRFILYPGDCFFTMPWQRHGSPDGFIDLGLISWMIIAPEVISSSGDLRLGRWSAIPKKVQKEIGRTLVCNVRQSFSDKRMAGLFDQVYLEIRDMKYGYEQMVNGTIDRIIITLTRSVKDGGCFDEGIQKGCIDQLEERLNGDLSYPWTLAEMAGIMGIGQTTLNTMVRNNTGFSPGQYLNHLRISKAKKLLGNSDTSITEIALDCGFSSSQHFSTSFKRSTGYTPRDYRKEKNG